MNRLHHDYHARVLKLFNFCPRKCCNTYERTRMYRVSELVLLGCRALSSTEFVFVLRGLDPNYWSIFYYTTRNQHKNKVIVVVRVLVPFPLVHYTWSDTSRVCSKYNPFPIDASLIVTFRVECIKSVKLFRVLPSLLCQPEKTISFGRRKFVFIILSSH
jgi:hypothetical protein